MDRWAFSKSFLPFTELSNKQRIDVTAASTISRDSDELSSGNIANLDCKLSIINAVCSVLILWPSITFDSEFETIFLNEPSWCSNCSLTESERNRIDLFIVSNCSAFKWPRPWSLSLPLYVLTLLALHCSNLSSWFCNSWFHSNSWARSCLIASFSNFSASIAWDDSTMDSLHCFSFSLLSVVDSVPSLFSLESIALILLSRDWVSFNAFCKSFVSSFCANAAAFRVLISSSNSSIKRSLASMLSCNWCICSSISNLTCWLIRDCAESKELRSDSIPSPSSFRSTPFDLW